MSGGEQPDTSGQGISDGSSVSLRPLMCLHHYSGGAENQSEKSFAYFGENRLPDSGTEISNHPIRAWEAVILLYMGGSQGELAPLWSLTAFIFLGAGSLFPNLHWIVIRDLCWLAHSLCLNPSHGSFMLGCFQMSYSCPLSNVHP